MIKWKVFAQFSFSCQKESFHVCVGEGIPQRQRTSTSIPWNNMLLMWKRISNSLNCRGALHLWLWADGCDAGVHTSRLNTTWMPSSEDSCQPVAQIPQLKDPLSHRRRLKPLSTPDHSQLCCREFTYPQKGLFIKAVMQKRQQYDNNFMLKAEMAIITFLSGFMPSGLNTGSLYIYF